MKRIRFFLIGLFTAVSLIQGCSITPKKPPETAKHINKTKFLGTWYEIANIPSFFQAGCSCSTGQYYEKDNLLGSKKIIKVHNKCYDQNKKQYKSVHGTVWIVENTQNTKLKIEFIWPFKHDYWILYADKNNLKDDTENYQTTIIATPDYKYMWILSRTPTISKQKQKELFNIAKEKGYDISKLELTPQNCSIDVQNKEPKLLSNQNH